MAADAASSARTPSPLETRDDLGRELGVSLLLKREDLLDDLGCGHKVRKLSFVIAEARRRGATVLMTAASPQSNQSKAVALMAHRAGLRAHILYGGDEQRRPHDTSGNYLLTSLLGARVTWREALPWARIEQALEEAADRERASGECPYVIAPGASEWPGLLGSLELGDELAAQLDQPSRETAVVCPAGSGGTSLGIRLAAQRRGLPWRVFGICVGEPAHLVRTRLAAIREDALAHDPLLAAGSHGSPMPAPATTDDNLPVLEDAEGGGYGRCGDDEFRAVGHVLREHGLLFDPIYMIKAYRALIRLIADGRIARASRVILIHTGGQFGLFNDMPAFADWRRQHFPDWVAPQGGPPASGATGG